jgi:hypothetical protein
MGRRRSRNSVANRPLSMTDPSARRKYEIPDFLQATLSQKEYERWLRRKAVAHIRRDKKRGNPGANAEAYRIEIHRAVCSSKGLDHYTGEPLEWALISKYDNAKSKASGRKYKATLALLPTIDHVGDGLGEAEFVICAWRTNDAKNDLTHQEFIALCRRVLEHSERFK